MTEAETLAQKLESKTGHCGGLVMEEAAALLRSQAAEIERLDWLMKNAATYTSQKVPLQLIWQTAPTGYKLDLQAFRAAIDAARAALETST
jgi:hypothetical protein